MEELKSPVFFHTHETSIIEVLSFNLFNFSLSQKGTMYIQN